MEDWGKLTKHLWSSAIELFSIYLILPDTVWPKIYSVSNRNEYHEYSWGVKRGKRVSLEASPPSVSGLSRKPTNETPRPESASELYRQSDRCLSAKLVPTFVDRECQEVSLTDPYGRILGFLDWSRYFFFQVVPQLYSRGWVDPFPDPLLLRKSGSAGNRTRTSGSVVRNSVH
jgi:hypothetical protein